MPNIQDWRELYAAVKVESDRAALWRLMELCESAIVRRLHDLIPDASADAQFERDELREASVTLIRIRVERLGWPDPEVQAYGGNDPRSAGTKKNTGQRRTMANLGFPFVARPVFFFPDSL